MAGESVTWKSLPNKDQLFYLVAARFSEPLVRTSLLTYIYYQLKSFDDTLSPGEIIQQIAVLQSVFTGAQCLTAIWWGKLADSPRGGRKLVLLIALHGSLVSCVSFGFIKSYRQAIILRAVEGAVNGNVAVIRTMVSEVVGDKRFRPRAFLLMPMCYNIAAIVSPVLGGLLADLAGSYPSRFGRTTFLIRFPYSPPVLLNGCIIVVVILLVFFGLRETLGPLRDKPDMGLELGHKILRVFRPVSGRAQFPNNTYTVLRNEPVLADEGDENIDISDVKQDSPSHQISLPFRRIFTRNVCLTIASHAILESHLAAYNTLWSSFLSTPVAEPAKAPIYLPFVFNGGLGMPPRDIGSSMASLGVFGIILQLFVYTRVIDRLGTTRTWRIYLWGFPITYVLIPYLSILPSNTVPPAEKGGAIVWIALLFTQLLIITSSTFVVPAQLTLTNNSSPHPSALGRTHGIAMMASSAVRTISPSVVGWVYSIGIHHDVIGIAWWGMALVSVAGCALSIWVVEGDGHEIRLESDNDQT